MIEPLLVCRLCTCLIRPPKRFTLCDASIALLETGLFAMASSATWSEVAFSRYWEASIFHSCLLPRAIHFPGGY
jgi:hypothetical protein